MRVLSSSRTAQHIIYIALLVVVGCLAYSNTLHVPFVFDDQDNIQNNLHIHLVEISPSGLLDAAFNSLRSARPVANLSFALNYYFSGSDVTGYHLVNIAIHILAGVLVYFLTLFILQQSPVKNDLFRGHETERAISLVALFAGLLFISHPVQIQSVTYIVQRMNSLATLFCFLSLLLYMYGRRSENFRHGCLFFTGSVITWLLALGSKQTAAILPLLILLYEWLFLQDADWQWFRKNAHYIAGILLLLVVVSLLFLGTDPLHRIMVDYRIRAFTPLERVLTELRIVVFYMTLILLPLPSRLNLLHYFPVSTSLFHPLSTFICLLIIAGLIIVAITQAKKYRLMSFCLLWFFSGLVIESSVIGLELIFEHRLYLPMFSCCLGGACLLYRLCSHNLKIFCAVMLLLTVSLTTATYIRNMDWRDKTTLWSDVVSKNPVSVRARYNLAKSYQKAGQIDNAIKYYHQTLELDPLHYGANNNLGIALVDKGQFDKAGIWFRKAIEIDSKNPDAYVNMGAVLEHQHLYNQAIDSYTRAIQIDPSRASAWYSVGNILQQQGKLDDAKHYFNKSLELQPDQVLAHNKLGVLLVDQGLYDEAIVHFNKAISIKPDFYYAYFNRGFVYRMMGNLDAACRDYREGLQYKPGFKPVQEDIDQYCKQAE